MSVYRFLRPLAFQLPPERAHELAMTALKLARVTRFDRLLRRRLVVDDERLAVEVVDSHFPNPVGLAAGFDKNARAPNALAGLGFGHIEVGAVTASPQAGNPRPRLFRLPEDRALINRMGFNNDGADVIAERLRNHAPFQVPIGVNLGKSKDVPLAEAAEDYRYTYERVAEHGDFFVVNVSSPNTPGLRELQDREPLEDIIDALLSAGAAPLLVKFSPDLDTSAIDEVIDVVETFDLAGIVAVNTTISRPKSLNNPNRGEAGGLSGAPLQSRAIEVVKYVATQTDKPIIGVGGVDGPESAYQMIRAGASLVQLYTAFVYEGPAIARSINRGLLRRLERDGHDSIEDAVGEALA